MKRQQIRTHLTHASSDRKFELSGWFDGKNTYLWFGVDGHYLGVLDGRRLLRLAKALVSHLEADKV